MPERLLGNRRVLESEGRARACATSRPTVGGSPTSARITFQVAEVKRPFLAVSILAKAGDDVYFTSSGGKIANRKSQRAINFPMVDGVYVLEMLIAPPRADSAGGAVGATGKSPKWSETAD
eukprot:9960554-Alexandrium_andersonii.AAC.1